MNIHDAYEIDNEGGAALAAPTKERSTSPGWGSWLAFLVFGFGVVAWLQNEQIVAWLLSNGIVDEGSTRTVPGVLRWISVAIAALGLTAAWRMLAAPASAVYGWAPVQSATIVRISARLLRRMLAAVGSP